MKKARARRQKHRRSAAERKGIAILAAVRGLALAERDRAEINKTIASLLSGPLDEEQRAVIARLHDELATIDATLTERRHAFGLPPIGRTVDPAISEHLADLGLEHMEPH